MGTDSTFAHFWGLLGGVRMTLAQFEREVLGDRVGGLVSTVAPTVCPELSQGLGR